MIIKRIILIFSLCLISFSCSREYIKPVSVKRNFSGALWIVRHNISSPQKIDQLLALIKDTNIKHLFVQVRGRGDSYYNSEFEPKANDIPAGFDPLKYLLKKTAKSDIKIHAWINVSFVLEADEYPPKSDHVLSRHPEWITYDSYGRPMTNYSKKQLDNNLAEGYFLDPAIPDVKDYIEKIICDVLSKYPVDGIHLDYIRYPYSGYNPYKKSYLNDFGYNPAARKIFKDIYGIDPVDIDRFHDSPEKQLFDKFRSDQITEIVKRVSHVVKSLNENLILSTAVMPRYDWGKKVYFQDWTKWLDNGYIDFACVMSYSDGPAGFTNYVKYANLTQHNNKIFMGINVNKKTSLKNAVRQIDMSYVNGMRGFSIFSFNHNKDFIDNLNDLIEYDRKSYMY